MNPIEEIINRGQNETIEFLSEIDELIDVAKICVALANKNGGSIFIGINGKSKIVGINPDPEIKLIQHLHEFIEGNVEIETIKHLIKHYYIIELKITKSNLPVLVKMINGEIKYYYRIESNTVEANKIIDLYLNLRKFGKQIVESEEHKNLLCKLGNNELNLSSLYKMMDLKPKEIDKLTAELIFLKKLQVEIKDKKYYYSRCKL